MEVRSSHVPCVWVQKQLEVSDVPVLLRAQSQGPSAHHRIDPREVAKLKAAETALAHARATSQAARAERRGPRPDRATKHLASPKSVLDMLCVAARSDALPAEK